MRSVDKNKSILAVFALFIFLSTNVLIYSNLHIHNFESLSIIHGHPYQHHAKSGSQTPYHTHSKSGFLFFASLFHAAALFALSIIIFILLLLRDKVVNSQKKYHYLTPAFSTPYLRAPPICCFQNSFFSFQWSSWHTWNTLVRTIFRISGLTNNVLSDAITKRQRCMHFNRIVRMAWHGMSVEIFPELQNRCRFNFIGTMLISMSQMCSRICDW